MVFSHLYRDVQNRIRRPYERSARHYNLRRRPEKSSVDQRVWRRNYVLSDAADKFTICRVVFPWTYELTDKAGKVTVWYAKDRKAHLGLSIPCSLGVDVWMVGRLGFPHSSPPAPFSTSSVRAPENKLNEKCRRMEIDAKEENRAL